MRNQKTLILDRDWDYLFILDACRYDIFERVYGDYLSGRLIPVKSAGSGTREWAVNTFENVKMDDVVYVSGNPWFNSKFPMKGFDARKHFHEIVDVWDWGWKEDASVRPKEMEKGVEKAEDEYPRRRKIIHYMQPHNPYLELLGKRPPRLYDVISSITSFLETASSKGTTPIGINEEGEMSLRRRLGEWLKKKIGKKGFFEMRSVLSLPPATIGEVIFREGRDGLHYYYEKNLRMALESVSNCCSSIQGKAVVSADHGEFLGEKASEIKQKSNSSVKQKLDKAADETLKVFGGGNDPILHGHHNLNNPILRTVPWLEVK
ncbi:hypothetical protein AKJ38_01745 [candidate division MSBL1 archaeon SCGC-AAA259I14]|uniref:Uncharacterized protein n=1 Tax=candidate division MSBL1 archaeon SCGC-AAA259I14 TaxID=1698268 RepID=A0A133USU1_9EURY|nr:hypothetical protein AKJ38_01745 [candidate division MSBL1 archaeon SCGC-AAA259I14]